MLAIVLINYKSEHRTVTFVREELGKTGTGRKVIVVNNGATDESNRQLCAALDAQLIKDINAKCESCGCYVISNPVNSGFARGNNLGAEFAKNQLGADYLLFSNNDIRLIDTDICERMIDVLNTHEDVGLVGPRVVGLQGELQSPEPYMSFWNRHIWVYLCTPFVSKKWKEKCFNFKYAENAKEGYHYRVMGSFFMVRAKDFFDCGMMDPNTFLYAEEQILSERMLRIGKRCYYYPAVSVLHEHGATTKKHLKEKRVASIQFESECYYYREYRRTNELLLFIGRIIHNLMKLMK